MKKIIQLLVLFSSLIVVACSSNARAASSPQKDWSWESPALQQKVLRQAQEQDGLRQALLQHLQDRYPDGATAEWKPPRRDELRYIDAEYDLNGDGRKELITMLVGPLACGTGGCTMLIWQREGKEFRLVGETVLVRPPIFVSPRSGHGWQNLIAYSGGGGAPGGYVELQYDGTAYPESSNRAREQGLVRDLQGAVRLLTDQHYMYGKPLH